MTQQLVLSLFPGADLLGMAFEAEGFCVVQGPDVIFGRTVKGWHAPAGRFDGVIGGPPCKRFSQCNQAARLGLQPLAENLIPEFERVVSEAQPTWFVMENVIQAPLPVVPGYAVHDVVLNNRHVPDQGGIGGVQNRVRRFSFGTRDGRRLFVRLAALESADYSGCFTANGTQWERTNGAGPGAR